MRLRIRGRGARGGRRTAALAPLLALALAAPLSANADSARPTAAPSADDIRQYEIHVDHNTPVTRTAIAAAGVTVDEADEETVVVSGRAGHIERLRRTGYRGPLPGPGRGPRPPSAGSSVTWVVAIRCGSAAVPVAARIVSDPASVVLRPAPNTRRAAAGGRASSESITTTASRPDSTDRFARCTARSAICDCSSKEPS